MPPLLSSIAAATARAYGFAAASFPTETTVEYLVIAGGGERRLWRSHHQNP
jgi:hypothetical protein